MKEIGIINGAKIKMMRLLDFCIIKKVLEKFSFRKQSLKLILKILKKRLKNFKMLSKDIQKLNKSLVYYSSRSSIHKTLTIFVRNIKKRFKL